MNHDDKADMQKFVKEFVFIGLPMIAIGVVVVCYVIDKLTLGHVV